MFTLCLAYRQMQTERVVAEQQKKPNRQNETNFQAQGKDN